MNLWKLQGSDKTTSVPRDSVWTRRWINVWNKRGCSKKCGYCSGFLSVKIRQDWKKIGAFRACCIKDQGKHMHLQNMVNCIRPCATVASKADNISVFGGCTVQLSYSLATFFTPRPSLSWYLAWLFFKAFLFREWSRNQKQQTLLELTRRQNLRPHLRPSESESVFWTGFCRILYCLSQTVKNLPAMAGDPGSIPESGRSPGEGNGNTLQ